MCRRCCTLLLYSAENLRLRFRFIAMNCGAMGIRTPDLLHAISGQDIHCSPFSQVTVPQRALLPVPVRGGCCTFLLCGRRRRSCCYQLEAPVQGMREPLHRRLGRVASATLDPAHISLRDASQARQLSLREAVADAGLAELKPRASTSANIARTAASSGASAASDSAK
jgi:hypothetical protein